MTYGGAIGHVTDDITENMGNGTWAIKWSRDRKRHVMSVTDGIGQTPCSFEHYLVIIIIITRTAYRGVRRSDLSLFSRVLNDKYMYHVLHCFLSDEKHDT